MATTSPKSHNWFPYCFIILIGFLVYIPAISNGFIWDDDVMLTENAVMKAADGLRRIWFSTELSDYFPLTSTSFWIEWRIWGTNATGYNVTNILLHTLSGMLLWKVFQKLKIPGAWIAAVLFTVHPVCVASVDWIAERKNTLSMVFYLAALLLYFRFETAGQRRYFWYALGTFLLALLSKTSVVVLPAVLLLCAWWQRGRISKNDLVRTAPFFALAVLMGLVTVWFQLHEVLTGDAQETDTLLIRVLGGNRALWFYLGKIVWPFGLSMVYEQWQIDPHKWIYYLPGALWLSMLGTFWWFRRAWGRHALFAFGYFTIALGPVLGFVDMDFLRFSQVADHLQYIAIPSIIALVVAASVALWQKIVEQQNRERTWLPTAVKFAMVLFLSLLTWKQSSVYVDEESLWRDTIKKSPNAWIGYHNLADRLAELKRFDEAAHYYQESLRLEPDYAKTHNNLGNCLHILGRFDEAMQEFLDAIQTKPELAEAHHNLGTTLYQRKEYAKALESFRTAVELKPDYAVAHFAAGNCAFQLGDLANALNFYFAAARYNPDAPDVQYNIGVVLSATGETNAAVHYLRTALRLNPTHDLAKKELQLILASTDER